MAHHTEQQFVENCMTNLLREISILQLVPAVCAGVLFTGMGLFLYLYISSRQKVHLAMFILSFLAALVTTCEFFFIVYGAVVKNAQTAVQFHRFEQVLGAYYIFAMPFFLYHHLSLKPSADRITRIIYRFGAGAALFITLIAFLSPDLFISIESTRLTNWHIDIPSLRRGQEGLFYHIRDGMLGMALVYSIIILVLDIITNKSFRYTFIILIGSLIGFYCAAVDIIHVYTGYHLDFFKTIDYQRFPVGLSIFLLLSMASVFRKFLDSDKELKQANIQLIKGKEMMRSLNISLERALNDQKKSLKEKEILLKEIHHRVKNNLQIINSLLYLQSTQNDDHIIEHALVTSQNRISAMALIHDHLYHTENLSTIDMEEYLCDLVSQLSAIHHDDNTICPIRQYISAGGMYIPLDIAMPVGLITNELVTNSLVHGLKDCLEGKIVVELMHHNNRYKLTVEDNGSGMSAEIDTASTGSLGLSLVRLLSKQLHGTFALENKGGTKATIEFNPPSPDLQQ